MNWLSPLSVRMPKKPQPEVAPLRYAGKKNSGRRGTPVRYLGIAYRSLQAAADANGITKATLQWRLLHR